MTDYITRNGIRIARELIDFVDNHALSGTGIDTTAFWKGFAALLAEMTPQNRALLGKRDDFQAKIDTWHSERAGQCPVLRVHLCQ